MSGAEQISQSNSTAPIVATVAPPEIVFNPVNPHLSIVEETAEEPYRLRSPSESSYLAASAGCARGRGNPLRSISPIEDIPVFINGKKNIRQLVIIAAQPSSLRHGRTFSHARSRALTFADRFTLGRRITTGHALFQYRGGCYFEPTTWTD